MTPMLTRTHTQGFTLIEVLVSMFILVIGIIGVMQMLPSSILQARMAAERSVGSQVARNVLGSVRAADAESITSGALEHYDEDLDDITTPDIEAFPLLNLKRVRSLDVLDPTEFPAVNPTHLYGYQTIFQPIGGSESNHLYKVVLVLDYADGRTESYVTFVSKL